jgi:hypothetical protein
VERLLAEADRRMYSMKKLHHRDSEETSDKADTKARGTSAN